jgi:6-pyruvoyl-tetrahydropterin synthase
VVDIGRASTAVSAVLHELDFKNLDDEPAFAGKNTTTEFMAKTVFERVAQRIRKGELGPGSERLASMKVTLHESHLAWAAYSGAIERG